MHWGVTPSVVAELGVNGNTDHVHVTLFKLFDTMVEGNQLRWAYKSKVQRVEKQHRLYTFDGLVKVELVNNFALAQYRSNSQVSCGFASLSAHKATSHRVGLWITR